MNKLEFEVVFKLFIVSVSSLFVLLMLQKISILF